MTLRDLSAERRRRVTHRALPLLVVVAVAALVIGIVVGANVQTGAQRAARDYAAAWARGDYRAMYALLTPTAQRRIGRAEFERANRTALATATASRLLPGRTHRHSGGASVTMTVYTRVFGVLRAPLDVPVTNDKVDWRPNLVFPGLRPGESLTRRSIAPKRAAILSSDGKTIASGPARARAVPAGAASGIAGQLGQPRTAADREALLGRGFSPGTPVGLTGLERALELQVEGQPGGTLLASRRTLASASPHPATPVRSTIDLRTQAAAEQALGGQFGGIAAMDPKTGRIRALAGIAFSAPQPPGSTFKIVTATAALEAHLVKPSTPFPVLTKATIDGVDLENANGESCGGTFANSFAQSCNSVFAPLGVKIGAKRLVDTAERFGFNRTPVIPGAAPSTVPRASLDSPLAVGSAAIGQDKDLATPLQMSIVAATIANGGLRPTPTLLEDARPAPPVRVTTARVARTVEKLMIDVVQNGTGTSAALSGVQVAGKTGTAELKSTVGPTAQTNQQNQSQSAQNQQPETDAWFAAYAPVRRTKIALGVMFVKAGAGGSVAAPAARIVLAQATGSG